MANRSTILSEIHSTYILNDLLSLRSDIVAAFPDTGNLQELSYLQNHVGREFYRKLDLLDGSITNQDETDAGFRPITVDGLLS